MELRHVTRPLFDLTLTITNVEAGRLRHILAIAGQQDACKDDLHGALIDGLLGHINTMLDEQGEPGYARYQEIGELHRSGIAHGTNTFLAESD